MKTLAKKVTRRISGRRLSWAEPWLTIKQSYTDATTETTVYRVEERGSDAGRSFDLYLVHGDALASYRVDLAGNGQQACTCPANAWKQNCKHCDAIRKLIDLGKLGATGYPAAE